MIADGAPSSSPVETATTVKHGEAAVVVDGPFNEAKEVIGGFSVIDVPDMDAAIALTKTWPHARVPGREPSRSGRWSRTTASSSDPRATTCCARARLREESGRLVAALYRRFGDFDVAEEAVQGAVVEALASWRRDGTPDRPGAWLATAAQRNAMDLLRSRGRRERTTQLLAEAPPREQATAYRPPTTGSRCCSPAATRRSRRRPGCRSPCARSSVSPRRRSRARSSSTSRRSPSGSSAPSARSSRPASTYACPTDLERAAAATSWR